MDNKNPAQSIPTNPWAFTWYAARQNRGYLFVASVGIVVATLIYQSTPYLFKLVVDAVETGDTSSIPLYLLLYPVSFLLIQLFYRVAGYGIAHVCIIGKEYLYNQLSAYLLDHSKEYFANRLAGSVVTKVSTAANAFENFVEFVLWNYLDAFVTFSSALVFISLASPMAGAIVLGTFVVLFIVNYISIKTGQNLSAGSAEAQSTQNGVVVDVMANSIVVRQFGQQQTERQKISEVSFTAKLAELRIRLFGELMLIKGAVVIFIGFTLLMFILVSEWESGQTSTGSLVFVLGLLIGMAYQLLFLGNAFQNGIQQFGQLRDSIKEILQAHSLNDIDGAAQLRVANGQVSFKKIDFSYGSQNVFSNFSLSIQDGQRIGIVGKSGAGKTTLISLLLREYDVERGCITISGQDIKSVTQASLRGAITIVPQEPMLFHRSIRENIAYAKPEASLNEIIEVANKAHVDEFVSQLPNGYDTLVGERGVKLSGGQKQRIAIARAILKDSPILILDEATSALDSDNEMQIQQALHNLMSGKTVMAIAHRLSTLREMDRIVVLDDGKIIEDGSHEALLHHNGIYARLWKQQTGGYIAH